MSARHWAGGNDGVRHEEDPDADRDLVIAATAWATTLTCNIDRSSLMWTGKTRIEWGQMLYQHKCLNGQYFWLTQEQMNN